MVGNNKRSFPPVGRRNEQEVAEIPKIGDIYLWKEDFVTIDSYDIIYDISNDRAQRYELWYYENGEYSTEFSDVHISRLAGLSYYVKSNYVKSPLYQALHPEVSEWLSEAQKLIDKHRQGEEG